MARSSLRFSQCPAAAPPSPCSSLMPVWCPTQPHPACLLPAASSFFGLLATPWFPRACPCSEKQEWPAVRLVLRHVLLQPLTFFAMSCCSSSSFMSFSKCHWGPLLSPTHTHAACMHTHTSQTVAFLGEQRVEEDCKQRVIDRRCDSVRLLENLSNIQTCVCVCVREYA